MIPFNQHIRMYPENRAQRIDRYRHVLNNEWIRAGAILMSATVVLQTIDADSVGLLGTTGLILFVYYLLAQKITDSVVDIINLIQYYLLFIIFLPADVSIFVLIQSCVFGLIFGELVFGGRGYSFVHPVASALAFLFLTNHGVDKLTEPTLLSLVSLTLSTVLLLWYRCIDLALILSTIAGIVLLKISLLQTSELYLPDPLTYLFFILVVCDPGSTPSNRQGRIVYGLFAGILFLLFDNELTSLRSAVFAGFFVILCTPFIDWMVTSLMTTINSRSRSTGRTR